MTSFFDQLADSVLDGKPATEDDALAVLQAHDDELLDVVAAAGRLRREHFGRTVKVNYLVNLKSGLCPENCNYCSQALGSTADILKYKWLSTDEALEQAAAGLQGGATRVCMVSSGRGPTNKDVERVAEMVGTIKSEHPEVEICACLGLLKDGQAERLREAGVDAYNHNINTAESHHDQIVQTHTYADRVDTVEKVKTAGLSPCSGLIAGLGETDEQLVEALFALRELDSDSIPVNFLMPFDGTPLENTWELTPMRCVKILAMARFVCPDREVRIAGGREMHLRTLQGLALNVANSLFLGDYLTSEGQSADADLELIRDHGFTVLGASPRSRTRPPRRRTTRPSAAAARAPPSPRMPDGSADELLAYDREHVWHPYTSMTEPTPVRLVESASGVRLRLAAPDGGSTELVDGMSSWWAAIHGYAVPELDAAVRRQLDDMAHVMFGGLTHSPAIRLARAAGRPRAGGARARLPRRLGIGERRGRAEDGAAAPARPRAPRADPDADRARRLPRRHLRLHERLRPGGRDALDVQRGAAGAGLRRQPPAPGGDVGRPGPTSSAQLRWIGLPSWPGSSSSRCCRARAGCSSTTPSACA